MNLPKSLTSVTPLSKFLAGTLFVLLPLIAFYMGMKYQEKITPKCELSEISQCPQLNNQNKEKGLTGMANPASVNCTQKGGTLTIMKRGDGGEYGLCGFDNGRTCEEWALFRGECPIGGVKTTGLDTEKQKYCVYVGGSTSVIDPNCTFKDGSICTNASLYNGTCQKGESQVRIIFPKGGETLIKGKEYTLKWTGGPSGITINLIDKSLENIGYSASLLDRLDHVENTGIYVYTVPTRLPDGTYKFSIGGTVTSYFKIVSPR